eukprot:CAMPEP_0195527964 /NCGR_PEP_ID=MMETSP0794_2-20130614/29908_1 /TAXON_ID=515487 /ORGANISM="Stephanopyxis turris, Strain CCMP 815" /LENGTH=362 /DNA_ID=CAMNT_0040658991 /DNA_START=81 /DNA_END=1169 /DNA_ORIENTATION=-
MFLLFYMSIFTFCIPRRTLVHAAFTITTPSPTSALSTQTIPLTSGVNAEVISSFSAKDNKSDSINRPPLVFIHGSFHASWCWAKHYMPYFIQQGYNVAALSLRGTGGTFAGEGVKKVQISEHVNDVSAFLQWVKEQQQECVGGESREGQEIRPPVLIAHSFGGLAVMKYLEKIHDTAENDAVIDESISGVALFCSVPPSGNGKMTMRYLRRSLKDSWKITAGLAMKKCITDKSLCRELFFDCGVDNPDDGISDEELETYQGYFKRDTVATIDLGDLARKLPSAKVSESDEGAAPFVFEMKTSRSLVVGAIHDFIVDSEGVKETAAYFGVKPSLVDSPHDVMLGAKWENGANTLLRWLDEEIL